MGEEPVADEAEILEPGNDVATSGGNATGGTGGSDGNTSGANYKVGLKERNVDITMDEKGNTFVNGKKMHEEELANGTKVFIFKNTEEKQSGE